VKKEHGIGLRYICHFTDIVYEQSSVLIEIPLDKLGQKSRDMHHTVLKCFVTCQA